jgi:hypothetical protein
LEADPNEATVALFKLILPSIRALERAIEFGDNDDSLSVKAAIAVLDRTGFGTRVEHTGKNGGPIQTVTEVRRIIVRPVVAKE